MVSKFPVKSVVRYTKTGKEYVILACPDSNNSMKLESGWVPAYSYTARHDPRQTYHRSQTEMEDGRFERR